MYLISSHVVPLLYTHVESIPLSFSEDVSIVLILWNFKFKKMYNLFCSKSYLLLSDIAFLNLINICQ